MEQTEQETKTHRQDYDAMSEEDYQIGKLRREFVEFQDKIADKLLDMKTEIQSVRNSLNRSGGKLGGYTMKELMMLKQLGINPKDLLTTETIENHGEKAQKT